jgi:transcriptional regulator with PAS, ATPase and Fis domain
MADATRRARESFPALLLGQNPAIDTLRTEIARAARTQAQVLIVGETGVGKEIVARLIHDQGPRARAAFVTVNCSGVPETLLESELFGHTRGSFTGAFTDTPGLVRQAHRGTLFLDELGEMSLRMQAVLLRFAETGEARQIGAVGDTISPVKARIIAATNRNLRACIQEGRFREDLYYRLNVVQIDVPPLRARGDDVVLLFEYYLETFATALNFAIPSITDHAAELLLAYHWPGNVRELRNVAERVVVENHSVLTVDCLPAEIRDLTDARVLLNDGRRHPFDNNRWHADAAQDRVDAIWDRLGAGEDFWTAVHRPFKARELCRSELSSLIDRGLRETGGSYKRLLRLFNIQPDHYKRFHAFLYQQKCNLPVHSYRKS